MAMHVCVHALVIIPDDHTVLFNLVSKHPKNIRLGGCVHAFVCQYVPVCVCLWGTQCACKCDKLKYIFNKSK